MKKSLKVFLLSLSIACLAAAVGCSFGTISASKPPVDESNSESSTSSSEEAKPQGTLKVDFADQEGYTIVSDVADGDMLCEGDILSFSVDMSVFYTGYPVVSINGKAVAPNDDGIYEIEMKEAVEITVSGIQKDVSNMAGTGAFDDAYVISRPIDLLYIAEQVNAGVPSYVMGAYVIANDIDCGGEELQVIGDLSTENAFFSGCVTCYTDAETGEMVPATISNFVINSDDANYVGLFGTVYADLSVTSSGLFYGVNLENFTINASLDDDVSLSSRSISVGSLVGYGVGVNLYLCNATNGAINVYGDSSYFSFAGGLIGYQQAFYMAEYDSYFSSEIVYSTTDVDVRIMQGMALYAGGISGYLATSTATGATAFIHNSYARGNVSGALRSGGIAGGLGQYTSVSNCYATGNIFAVAHQSLDNLIITETEYCYANAGGIIGFAENDTIINDCFFDGKTAASSATVGCASTSPYIGGGYEKGYASASAEQYIVNNCINEVDLTDNRFFTDTLSWGNYDWTFARNEYPTICYESPENTVSASMTLRYVSNGEEVLVENDPAKTIIFFDTGNQSINIYAPMGNYFLSGGIKRTIRADNGYLSYGYYFDEACTQKVPYAYVPQKNITLYIGFANPTPLLGTYDVVYEGSTKPITLHFENDGTVSYSDGTTYQTSYYFYDGETLTIEGARLTRYYDGAIVVDEDATDTVIDAYFDLYRYSYYDFSGKIVDGALHLYDGVYFTESAPMVAKSNLFRGEYYTTDGTIYRFYGDKATAEHGSTYTEYTYVKTDDVLTLTNQATTLTLTLNVDLKPFDAFKGTWTKSATVNKAYTFDGMGNWTYTYISYDRTTDGYFSTYEEKIVEQKNGTYQIVDGVLTLSDTNVTAQFNADGFLVVTDNGVKQTYYAAGSHVGTWTMGNLQIRLLGIGNSGLGEAELSYGDGNLHRLVYEVSETNGYVCLYWPHDGYGKDALFGYFTYDAATNTLYATLSDSNNLSTGYSQSNLFVIDDYNGEWICDKEEFSNIEFTFNGNGLYGFLYGYAGMEGKLTLLDLKTNKKTELSYTLDSTLKGHFAYNGLRYVMQYDEDAMAVVISAEGVMAELQRKDTLTGIPFIDLAGNTYAFDGRSNLSSTGGKLVVNGDVTYTYVTDGDGWLIQNGDDLIGAINLSADKRSYNLTLNGTQTALYVENEFIGEWAIGGAFGLFNIGPTDLKGSIQANYKGHNVTLTTLETNLLTF